MAQDLAPLKIKKSPDFVAVLQCINRNGKYFQTKATKYKLSCNRINKYDPKSGGAFGAWKLTKLYNNGGGPTLDDIITLFKNLKGRPKVNRSIILKRLNQMGVSKIPDLKRRQYKSFYNFLINLK